MAKSMISYFCLIVLFVKIGAKPKPCYTNNCGGIHYGGYGGGYGGGYSAGYGGGYRAGYGGAYSDGPYAQIYDGRRNLQAGSYIVNNLINAVLSPVYQQGGRIWDGRGMTGPTSVQNSGAYPQYTNIWHGGGMTDQQGSRNSGGFRRQGGYWFGRKTESDDQEKHGTNDVTNSTIYNIGNGHKNTINIYVNATPHVSN